MSGPTHSMQWLWPTPVMFAEFMGDDVNHHNTELERVVISGCNTQAGSIHELRLYDLHQTQSESVAWLAQRIKESAAVYCGFSSSVGI